MGMKKEKGKLYKLQFGKKKKYVMKTVLLTNSIYDLFASSIRLFKR